MYYYGVWVRSPRYQGKQALTYAHDRRLTIGSIVRIELQHQLEYGIVVEVTAKPRIRAAIKAIHDVTPLPPLPRQLIQTASWLQQYYPSSIGAVASLLLPPAIPQKPKPAAAVSGDNPVRTLPPLTPEQAAVLPQFGPAGSHLLHGRTGSGKTRLYQELAGRAIAGGRSVIVLSPEIGLTSQLARSFTDIANAPVIVLHSQLTPAERFQAWLRLASGPGPFIVVGARSALFSPLNNIGLIVVDEAHEPAYKQEQAPRYHAVRVASQLATVHQAQLVLGSATPTLVDYYLAEQKKRPIIRLSELAQRAAVTTGVEIVDLKNREAFTRSPYMSDVLLARISGSLVRGEQSLLYLNRRGTARISLCQHCGWQALCPHCELPLTYHGDTHRLRCHVCGHSSSVPTSCPECGHSELVFRGIGTKAVVTEVTRLFPESSVIRFDSDNAKADRFEQHYERVVRGEVDIIIGTQTLAKGLDLPKLSTLGVLVADSSLNLPDYTAEERTYQLINQVFGRVRRGHRAAHAIIQTYSPDSSTLAAALADNWPTFYERELASRKLFDYPPFWQLLKITCRRATARSAEKACQKLKDQITRQFPAVQVDGPAPALHEKFQDSYQWQLIVKARTRSTLLAIIADIPAGKNVYDLDPLTLL